MQLREFTLISPTLEAGQVFKAIESGISIESLDEAIANSKCQSQRHRKLPAHLVVCLVIAFSFWSKAAMREILDAQLPPRSGRVNPRVVKKSRSKFPAKKRHHFNQGTQRPQLRFAIPNSA